MHTADETTLIQTAKNGDMNAFEELILQHERIVYNIALRMLSNPEDAKDISQEVFIKVYKNLKKFDNKSSFSTWIYRICVNTCIDSIRKKKGKETLSIDEKYEGEENTMDKQMADPSPSPEESMIHKEYHMDIQNAINLLSEEHKTILTLRDLEGFSYSEITELTDSSLGTVKSRLSRARLQLKNILLKNAEHFQLNDRQKSKKGGEKNEL